MMNSDDPYTEAEQAFVNEKIAEGCTPIGFVAAFSFLDENGNEHISVWNRASDLNISSLIGVCEMMKLEFIRRNCPDLYREDDE